MVVGVGEVAPQLLVEVRKLLLQFAVSVGLLFVELYDGVVVGLQLRDLLGLLLHLRQEVLVGRCLRLLERVVGP